MNSRIFQKYYEQLRLPLGMFSLRFTLSVEAAEDIVQSVFLEIWDKFNDEKEPDNFKSYIYRAVRNASLNWCRDNGRMERPYPSNIMRNSHRKRSSTRQNGMPAYGKPLTIFRKNAAVFS